MKKITLILTLCIVAHAYLCAQPALTEKAVLDNELINAPIQFSNSLQRDTVQIPFFDIDEYTLEIKAKVSSATGRGLDMEARSISAKGFRTSLDVSSLNWTSDLASASNLVYSNGNSEQTIRYAVKDGSVHIYQNGVFLATRSLASIKDIDDSNNETDPVFEHVGENSIGTWAGNGVLPTSLGWSGSTSSIPWAVSGSGVRYENVTHDMDGGGSYSGTLLTIRWDNSNYSSATYFYPVTLEANTAYDFSFLYEYWGSASTSQTLTAGISTTATAAGIYESKNVATTVTKQILRPGQFVFTSKEAGQYYLTFKGTAAMFAIGKLELKKIKPAPRLLFGKNYVDGEVNMELLSVKYETTAYAPVTGSVSGTIQDLVIDDARFDAYIFMNTNVILNGKTELHFANGTNPLLNSTLSLNSDDAWVYFDNMRPSEVSELYLDKIKINGSVARKNVNMRIAINGTSAIVIPMIEGPLEVFTEPNFGGESRKFSVETYHNNLGTFNNKIRSFKLKKGYMATFANNADGTGYSRIFIADKEDRVVTEMPQYLDGTASFIRVFKWNWITKKGWCQIGSGAKSAAEKTKSTWYYTWSADQNSTDNQEYVPIRHNPGWPSWSQINGLQNVTHVLGFNEPDRPDQANMSVETAISQWPEMMKSGLRIGSPVPSDLGAGSGWLYTFLDRCTELNYRVDFVVVHAYWGGLSPSEWYNKLKSEYERCGRRPLWITEWNNGADWTKEWWPDGSDAQKQKQLNDLKGILNVLDTCSFVERYSIYDWVNRVTLSDGSMKNVVRNIIQNGNLTPAGEYYAANKSRQAFNPSKGVAPGWKPVVSGVTLHQALETNNTDVMIYWTRPTDELINKFTLERKLSGEANYLSVGEFTWNDDPRFIEAVSDGAQYRLKMQSTLSSSVFYSNVVTTNKDIQPQQPTGLTATDIKTSSITLSWDATQYARNYKLQRSTEENGTYEIIKSNIAGTSYTDSGLDDNVTYFYKISAENYAGESGETTPLMVTTKELLVPGMVEGLFVSSGDGKVTLIWDYMEDATFKVMRGESADGPFVELSAAQDSLSFIDNDVDNGKKYYYQVKGFNERGENADDYKVEANPETGLHAYFDFDEQHVSKVLDQWGGFHSDLPATVVRRAGKHGNSVAFDGTASSYIQLPDGIASELNTFTIMTWVNFNTLSNNTRIFDFGNSTTDYIMLSPNVGSNKIRYKLLNNEEENVLELEHELPLQKWVHLTLRKTSIYAYLYVDGQQIGRSATPMLLKPSSLGVTAHNYIGKSQWSSDPLLDGRIDDFRIYNYALSEDEIVAAMNNGTITNIGTNSIDSDAEVVLYPNPVNDVLNIATNGALIKEIVIYDISGQKVFSEKLNSDTGEINLSALARGMYIVEMKTDSQNISKRILKR